MAASGSSNSNIEDWDYEIRWHEEIQTFFIQHTAREAKNGNYKHGGFYELLVRGSVCCF